MFPLPFSESPTPSGCDATRGSGFDVAVNIDSLIHNLYYTCPDWATTNTPVGKLAGCCLHVNGEGP